MIVVYPFSVIDEQLALKNVRWMNELGGCKGHECLMIPDARCREAVHVMEELRKCFDNVYVFPARAEVNGWPEGANYMFRSATAWLGNSNRWKHFMWMEPDAIPLESGWLTSLENEYQTCGKPFMGDRVQVNDIPLHMSGVGIYPNPLHAYAGEAYRAADVAWDMAGKDQIVPQAHFTKLIEHAWKHPTFTMTEELSTQIRPGVVLFHSSKDGSLIDLLRSKQGKETNSSTGASSAIEPKPKEREEPRSPSPAPTCDIFIRTYPKDYPWLKYCLQSINKYANGFRKVWVISTEDAPLDMASMGYEWKKMNEETKDGYLAQQIHKLYADVITDYQADYILLLDSDTLFTQPVTPQDFFRDGKLIWYMTPYDKIETPWKPVTEKFMGKPVEYEFMRRLPMMMPRWLFPKLREYCYSTHGIIVSDYIRNQPLREFSEFNALGAFAHQYHRDQFHWVDTLVEAAPAPLARQFFSWGGITDEVKVEINGILGVEKEPEKPSGNGEVTPKTPLIFDMLSAISFLKEFASLSTNHRQRVMMNLSKSGLTPRHPKKKKKVAAK